MATTQTVDVKELLNKQVANFGVLYIKLHQFHWYVKGPQFFTLHAKFEELYDETTAAFDDLAERLLTIGGSPYSTLKEYLEHASLQESTDVNREADEFVKELINDYTLLSRELGESINSAAEAGDDVTQDLFIGLKGSLEKHVWMLQAYLG
ncbi:DNA starvation/stationary phase protection protein [Terrilactibacillus sp. BCM23-1]|uniref:DNA starvation/stationary phase protection protein n=1 Tax=Terrilactibacillus tamarindi TaxID=2599694 RepID=A0A6N8CNN2_9BACI|nr:DNA starvation/stationary phase protection protein [Terrilactibacillus tamarindi]MTT30713.1 DNA starvation/stationary phase protection protein [Terrilactibacillus tamarindi]